MEIGHAGPTTTGTARARSGSTRQTSACLERGHARQHRVASPKGLAIADPQERGRIDEQRPHGCQIVRVLRRREPFVQSTDLDRRLGRGRRAGHQQQPLRTVALHIVDPFLGPGKGPTGGQLAPMPRGYTPIGAAACRPRTRSSPARHRARVACSISVTEHHSSVLCACSVAPGPRITVGGSP